MVIARQPLWWKWISVTKVSKYGKVEYSRALNASYTFQPQPPPQALRFSHGRGERETSDWWWTARDHGKGTDGRSPSRLPLGAHFHQKRDVWVRGSFNPLWVSDRQNDIDKIIDFYSPKSNCDDSNLQYSNIRHCLQWSLEITLSWIGLYNDKLSAKLWKMCK